MESDREIIDQFVLEAREHLDTIEDDLLHLERQKEHADRALVDRVFRAIHSIKGASGFLGLRKIGDLAHVMETLLSMMRAGEIRPEAEFIDALLAGADLLATMVDDVDHSNDMDITKLHDRLASLLARAMSPQVKDEMNTPVKLSCSNGDDIGFDINEFTMKNISPNMSLYVLKYDLTELHGKERKSPVNLISELLSTGEIIDAKVDIPFNDLHAGLPQESLIYEVLYATFLLPDDIQEITGLPEDLIIHVKKEGFSETVPISSGFRMSSSTLRMPVSEFQESPVAEKKSEIREQRAETITREAEPSKFEPQKSDDGTPSKGARYQSSEGEAGVSDEPEPQRTGERPHEPRPESQKPPERPIPRPENRELIAQRPEPRTENRTSSAQTRESSVQSPEPEAQSPEPSTQSPEPEAQSPEPEAQSPEPEAQSPEPEAQSPEPSAQSPALGAQRPEPSAQSPAPRAQSPEPSAQSPEPSAQSPESDPAPDTGVDTSNSIRIHVDILDKLMLLVGELVLVRNQQVLSVDTADPADQYIAQRLNVVTTELQETVMRTRMQPIGKIFRKFPRIVRELGKSRDKQIRIDIKGNEVELDKTILESLADPLTHLIRNCCDHGIESPEERKLSGKSEVGHITLGAWHEAGHINIEIRDDGRGINPELIRQKAVEKRLKTVTEIHRMNTREIMNLILLPGFTTAEKVSDLSGRGVGMDVVKTGIEKLGGTLEIDSVVGSGTAFHLRLPLTLAIIPCLIVTSGAYRYAIPQVNLVELVCLYDDDVTAKIEIADNQEVFRLRNRLLPMVRLSEMLDRERRFTKDAIAEITRKYRFHPDDPNSPILPESLNFAVLKVGPDRFGLIIDRVLGTEEIVVKPMHPAMKSLKIYSGATVMGDGKVALILDAEGIAAHAGISFAGDIYEEAGDDEKRDEEQQTVLIFKYGRKEHFAMALPLIRRIERISASDIEYIGEKEFITINGTSTRVLHLDQILEVSPKRQRDTMFLVIPRYIRRPIGLLAAELVDIEETGVHLNVESYMEDGLLGTSVIHGHMTLFIDVYRLIEKIEPEWFADRRMGLFGRPGPPERDVASEEPAKRVLLVEDASFFRQLIKGYLEADGYEVVAAEHGKAGLEQMGKNRFDLVVSDIEMPVMDGWEFVKNIRQGERQSDIPTVALTALDSEEDRAKAIRCGYDRYEVKIDRERFLTTVAKMLDG